MTVVQWATSPEMTALIGVAVMAAILTTSDSLLNALTSNLTQDFSFLQQRPLSWTRMASIGMGVLAIGISFLFDNIVSLMIMAYELSVCTLVVPLLGALFKKGKGNAISAYLSIGLGAIAFFSLRSISLDFPKELTALALSAVGFFLGEVIARALPNQAPTHER